MGSAATIGVLASVLVAGAIIAKRLSLSAVDALVRGIVLIGALGLMLFALNFILRFWPVVVLAAGIAAAILVIQGLASWLRRFSGRG